MRREYELVRLFEIVDDDTGDHHRVIALSFERACETVGLSLDNVSIYSVDTAPGFIIKNNQITVANESVTA